MMERTDRHCRYFMRLISRHVQLYTEMITAQALLHDDHRRLLRYDPVEHPVALQLGGDDPGALAACARMAEELGYDEVNLNVGCPSPRVQSGRFGACLMKAPALVAECVAAMADAVTIPVTVKTRTGVDDHDDDARLHGFVAEVARAGCRTFIIHARKAWLKGLNPRENREVPPLQYERVHRLKAAFPGLEIILNGGVHTLQQAREHLGGVDGVMIGRAAYDNPYLLAEVDSLIYGDHHAPLSREQVLEGMFPYIRRELAAGTRLNNITRHMMGLYHGRPGSRAWRRHISEHAHKAADGVALIEQAVERMQHSTLRRVA